MTISTYPDSELMIHAIKSILAEDSGDFFIDVGRTDFENSSRVFDIFDDLASKANFRMVEDFQHEGKTGTAFLKGQS